MKLSPVQPGIGETASVFNGRESNKSERYTGKSSEDLSYMARRGNESCLAGAPCYREVLTVTIFSTPITFQANLVM